MGAVPAKPLLWYPAPDSKDAAPRFDVGEHQGTDSRTAKYHPPGSNTSPPTVVDSAVANPISQKTCGFSVIRMTRWTATAGPCTTRGLGASRKYGTRRTTW